VKVSLNLKHFGSVSVNLQLLHVLAPNFFVFVK